MSTMELELAEKSVLQRINRLIARKSEQFKWTAVDVSSVFSTGGSCSKRSMIRLLPDSGKLIDYL